MSILEKEFIELKNKVLELENIVNSLTKKTIRNLPISAVADELKISRQTLTYHLKANYEPEVDFYIKNNKIFMNVDILPSIRGHYNAK